MLLVKKDFKTLNRKFKTGDEIAEIGIEDIDLWISRGFVEVRPALADPVSKAIPAAEPAIPVAAVEDPAVVAPGDATATVLSDAATRRAR